MLTVLDLRGTPEVPGALRPGPDPGVQAAVRGIIARVRGEGDAALLDLTRRLDGADLGPPGPTGHRASTGLAVARADLDRAGESVPAGLREAIDRMIGRLRALHARQLPSEWWAEDDGLRWGEVVRPLGRVGCYVPGGRAAYPSTVAMTVVPARVAGVPEVIVCSPPRPDGSLPPAVLYAAAAAGATAVFRVGGAQAVAAMAYGTETVPTVDKVVGPGNPYVTEAKRQVAGDVGIDGLAGPTELVVVADRTADPEFLAADLVAQAEHDPLAVATLVTPAPEVAAAAAAALEREVEGAARREVVEAALRHGRAVVVEDLARAAEVVNALAPEHLQVVLEDPEGFLPSVRNAGAVFLGPWTAVPFGDYGVGSNHVLPTMGTARFAAGLRASDFVTVTPVVRLEAAAAERLAPEVAAIAAAEGLEGHARAVSVRARAAAGRAREAG